MVFRCLGIQTIVGISVPYKMMQDLDMVQAPGTNRRAPFQTMFVGSEPAVQTFVSRKQVNNSAPQGRFAFSTCPGPLVLAQQGRFQHTAPPIWGKIWFPCFGNDNSTVQTTTDFRPTPAPQNEGCRRGPAGF